MAYPHTPQPLDDSDSLSDDGERYRSRHIFRAGQTNVDVVRSVLERKAGLLGDVSRLLVFAIGDGEGGQASRSNNT